MTDAQPTPVDGRDKATGRFAKGWGGGGRPALPMWFRDSGHDALRTLLAAATGRASEDAPPAAKELAERCSDRVRVDAAKTVIERIYGKTPDQLEIQGDPIACIRRVVVDVGGVTPVFPPEDDEQNS